MVFTLGDENKDLTSQLSARAQYNSNCASAAGGPVV
jgi:hypothetical protein